MANSVSINPKPGAVAVVTYSSNRLLHEVQQAQSKFEKKCAHVLASLRTMLNTKNKKRVTFKGLFRVMFHAVIYQYNTISPQTLLSPLQRVYTYVYTTTHSLSLFTFFQIAEEACGCDGLPCSFLERCAGGRPLRRSSTF
jgi:hypothetical protein